MARRKEKPLRVFATQSGYLDPGNCDSMVSYAITSRRRLDAQIDLADCNRKITWYFYDEKEALQKIDRALFVLNSFRTDFLNAQKEWKKKPNRLALKKRATIH